MHRPIPGPFHGSVPQEDAPGVQLGRAVDVCVSFMTVTTACSVALAMYAVGTGPDPWVVLRLACLAGLAVALPAMWLLERTADAPRLAVTQLFSQVQMRVAAAENRQAVLSVPEDAYRGIAGLLGDLAIQARRLQAGRDDSAEAARGVSKALAAGREQARQLALMLKKDAAALGQAAEDISMTAQRLWGEMSAAQTSVEFTQAAMGAVTSGAVGLASAVRATTAEAERSTALAVRLSEAAFGVQRSIAGLDDKTASLVLATEAVAGVLKQAGDLGRDASVEAAPAGTQGGVAAPGIAAELKALAAAAIVSLDGMQAAVAELRIETGLASRRVVELSDLIKSQHDLGHAVCHAVMQQGEDIAAMLARLNEAHSGFATLRASVEAVTRTGAERAGNAEALRAAAKRLPTHAESVALILRGIPDFAPPADF